MMRTCTIFSLFLFGLTLCSQAASVLKIVPDRTYFDVGSLFQIQGVVENGTLVSDNPTLILHPFLNLTRDRGELTELTQEGPYILTAALPDFKLASRRIIVDDTPPNVAVDSPEHGTCVVPGKYTSAKGNLRDSHSGPDFIEINKERVPLMGDGTYEKLLHFRHGLNFVNALGYDRAGLSRLNSAQFYQSGEWIQFDPLAPLKSIKNNAVDWWFGRELFDRFQGTVENPNSLSHFLSLALGYLDLNGDSNDRKTIVNEEPVLSENGMLTTVIKLNNVEINNPIVDIEPSKRGLNIHGGFYGTDGKPALALELDIEITLQVLTYFYIPVAKFKTFVNMDSMGIQVDVQASKLSGEDMAVKIDNLHLDKGNVDVKISMGKESAPFLPWPLSGMFPIGPKEYLEWLVSKIMTIQGRDLYEHYEAEITGQLEAQVNDILKGIIGSFEGNIDFSTDTFPWAATSKMITLRSTLDTLNLSELGVEVGVNTGFMSDGDSAHGDLPIFGRNNCDSGHRDEIISGGLDQSYNVGARAHIDLLNQLSHALWRGGAFDLKLTQNSFSSLNLSEFGINNFVGATFLGLPPIINDCDVKGIGFEIGGAEIRAAFDAFDNHFDVTFMLSGIAELEVKVVNDKIQFWLAETHLHSFETRTVHEGKLEDKRMFETLVEHYMWEYIEKEFKGVFLGEFQIPSVELDKLNLGLPFDQVLGFRDVNITHVDGRFLIKTQLKDSY